MPYVRNTSYREMPLKESSEEDFYRYSSIAALIEKCKLNSDGVTRCRTIGLVHSVGSRYYLSDLKSPSSTDDETVLRISLRYLDCTQIPLDSYPVQVFGVLQWYKRPVVFVHNIQVLTIPIAIRLEETMSSIASKHMPSTPD